MRLEERLKKHLQQPGAFITTAEQQFIADMRAAARSNVGYGWMQQVIEWEWQSKSEHSFGPEYFEKRIAAMERK